MPGFALPELQDRDPANRKVPSYAELARRNRLASNLSGRIVDISVALGVSSPQTSPWVVLRDAVVYPEFQAGRVQVEPGQDDQSKAFRITKIATLDSEVVRGLIENPFADTPARVKSDSVSTYPVAMTDEGVDDIIQRDPGIVYDQFRMPLRAMFDYFRRDMIDEDISNANAVLFDFVMAAPNQALNPHLVAAGSLTDLAPR